MLLLKNSKEKYQFCEDDAVAFPLSVTVHGSRNCEEVETQILGMFS